MSSKEPTLDEWRKLYAAAGKVKELAPWEWMMEDEIFGVKNPETGEIGFVSVMGNLGEHLSVAVYPDPRALYKFFDIEDDAGEDDMMIDLRILEVPQLQVSFEDREQLDKTDRDIIKKLGLKFRGAQSWTQFRSYSPALLPWHLNAAEARYLTCVLEQVPDVARRFAEDEELLFPDDKDGFLVRVSREENGALHWEDQVIQIPRPAPQPIAIHLNVAELEKARSLPHRDHDLEMELQMLPAPVTEKKNDRPFFPYLLLIVDGATGMLIAPDMLKPVPSLEAMWGEVPGRLIEAINQIGFIPSIVRVRSDLLVGLLQELSVEIGFQIKPSDTLPKLDQALEFLMQTMPIDM